MKFTDYTGEKVCNTYPSAADPLDLLRHIAYNAPLRTRRERAQLFRREKKDFLRSMARKLARFLTTSWKSTWSMVPPSSRSLRF